jgi:beta-lactamase class A
LKTIKEKETRKSPFAVKIPLYIVVLLLIILSGGYYTWCKNIEKRKDLEIIEAVNKIDNVSLRLLVDDEYELIKPLAFVEFKKEDTLLLKIKESILRYIEDKKQEGVIVSASAYLRNLNRHQDVRINPTEVYVPGSLMKIPILITYLKEAEKNPNLLQKRLVFSSNYGNLPVQNIKVKSIQPGQSYLISELLEYMIVYSDNNATAVLNEHIEFDKIVRVFRHLQLPIPDIKQAEYGLTLKDYSRFFRVLYNATYLGWEMSEYALELLVRCNYKNGLVKYIDPKIKVAHKFGERNSDGIQQMHEVGIVYLKDRVYLIGIFTKGSRIDQLEEVVANISKIAFEGMKSGSIASYD